MTTVEDEKGFEVAKQYLEKKYAGDYVDFIETEGQAYLDGYEQGYEDCRHYAHDYYKDYYKPKWHDLRKNSDDLPKDETQVLIINKFDDVQYYLGYFDNFHSEWLSERGLKLFDVIAWCELPKFKE